MPVEMHNTLFNTASAAQQKASSRACNAVLPPIEVTGEGFTHLSPYEAGSETGKDITRCSHTAKTSVHEAHTINVHIDTQSRHYEQSRTRVNQSKQTNCPDSAHGRGMGVWGAYLVESMAGQTLWRHVSDGAIHAGVDAFIHI
jgi:hypothetical protein